MKGQATHIQPSVLVWARESIGLSIGDVASRLDRDVHEITSWETGEAVPTYVQLERLAYEVYKRPIAVFFFPEPPSEEKPANEFRSLPAADLKNLNSDTYLHVRKARAYKLALEELYSGLNPATSEIWRSVSPTITDDIATQAKLVRGALGVSMAQQKTWYGDEEALKQWRQAIEAVGVFVFKNAFKQKDISGFCIPDPYFPIIYINNSTTKTRQIFSLLHELSHILLSIEGMSKFDKSYIDRLPVDAKKIERFCNALAAEVLMPSEDFREQTSLLPRSVEGLPDTAFSALAHRYGVSREAILRRFVDEGRASSEFYEDKAREWTGQMTQKSGGDWYLSTNAYLSDRFVRDVFIDLYKARFNPDQAADLLGVHPKNLPGLEDKLRKGGRL